MTVILYYVLPMLLGRTYDMRTNSPGVDIFPQEVIDAATVKLVYVLILRETNFA